MYTFHGTVSLIVHHLVAVRLLIAIIVASIVDTNIHRAIVRVLIGGSEGEHGAYGMSKTEVKLPGSVHLKLVGLAVVSFIP